MKLFNGLLLAGIILASAGCKKDDYHSIVANSWRLGDQFYTSGTVKQQGNTIATTTVDGVRSLYFTFYELPVSNANFRIVSGTPAATNELNITANVNGAIYQSSGGGAGYAAITVSDTGRIDVSIVNTWMLHIPNYTDSLQLSADISE